MKTEVNASLYSDAQKLVEQLLSSDTIANLDTYITKITEFYLAKVSLDIDKNFVIELFKMLGEMTQSIYQANKVLNVMHYKDLTDEQKALMAKMLGLVNLEPLDNVSNTVKNLSCCMDEHQRLYQDVCAYCQLHSSDFNKEKAIGFVSLSEASIKKYKDETNCKVLDVISKYYYDFIIMITP